MLLDETRKMAQKSTRAVMTLAFSDKKCSRKLVFDASRVMQS